MAAIQHTHSKSPNNKAHLDIFLLVLAPSLDILSTRDKSHLPFGPRKDLSCPSIHHKHRVDVRHDAVECNDIHVWTNHLEEVVEMYCLRWGRVIDTNKTLQSNARLYDHHVTVYHHVEGKRLAESCRIKQRARRTHRSSRNRRWSLNTNRNKTSRNIDRKSRNIRQT